MQTDFLSPLMLVADPFTLGRDDGAIASPNPVSLINPNRTAMLIDEFRVSYPGRGGTQGGVQSQVFMNLMFGSTPLTNGFIPMRAVMPYYLLSSNAQANIVGDGADNTAIWHLPRPLYVPPNVQVNVNFLRKLWPRFTRDETEQSTIGFSIAGRSMPSGMEIPKKIFVPWACATTQYLDGQEGELPLPPLPTLSNDADVCNPFDVPLNIDYLVGMAVCSDGSYDTYDPTIQMTLSSGKVLARDPIPMSALFPPNRPIARMRALLQPKEFVSVAFDLPPPTTGRQNPSVLMLGMTGWREMQTPLGALP